MMRRFSVLALTILPLVFAVGCGKGGTPAASSGSVSFNVSSLTFASTNVGSSAGVQTLTLTNSSSAAISITSILVSGNNSGDFSQTNTCGTVPATLAAGASCNFSVNFTPTASTPATRLGTISVVDNASNSPQTVTLTGTAVAVLAPIATLSGNSLVFTAVTNGTATGPQSVTLTNTGTAALTGISITIPASTNSSDFTLTTSSSPCGTSLAASSSCIIAATFTAPAPGSYTASISIADNATGSPQTIALTGTGAAPLADFSPSPGFLTFGATVVSATSTAQTLTFANSGGAADTVTSVAISGTNAGDFNQTNNCTTIASNASCAISVTFTPTAAGSRTAVVTVTDNSNGTAGTTHTATLTGTAVASAAPTVTVSPSSLTFTSSTAQGVTVTNTGASAVSVTGVTISGTNASAFNETNGCGTSIAVGASCTISVTFVPGGTAGSFTATLNIADNVSGSPQTVGLSGTAIGVATFSPSSLTLNEATLSTTSATQTIKLTNTGTASMGSIVVSITGTSASNFAQTNTCGTTLAVNAYCNINVTFTPTASGTVTANVSVADNGTGSPQTVPLTGNGPGTATVTTTLVTVPDDTYTSANPNTMAQVDNFVLSATSTIDMTIYELTDTTLINDLVTQCKTNGVKVRVLLDHSEQSTNQSAYNTITAGGANCLAVFSNTHFTNTHEKSIVIDAAIPAKAQVLISTGNFEVGSSSSCGSGCVYNYYTTGRDFQLYENDANDVAAVEATFVEDFTFSYGTTYPSYTPGNGDDLVWSPTNATTAISGVISGATKTLVVDEEEMSSSACYNALATAASSGVSVKLTTPTGEISSSVLSTLKSAGVKINQYPASGNYLYIHAKVVVADAGTPNEKAFMGSENCSSNSLNNNRELGIVLTDSTSANASTIIGTLNTKLTNDFNCVSEAPTQTTVNCTSP